MAPVVPIGILEVLFRIVDRAEFPRNKPCGGGVSTRVFNNAMGHLPTYFATPAFANLVLRGIQFALGDLELDTTPSARLTGKRP